MTYRFTPFKTATGCRVFVKHTNVETPDNPVAVYDTYAVEDDEDSITVAAVDGVLANDTDPASLPLTASLVTDVTNGVLVLSADGSFVYTRGSLAAYNDSFIYRASNGTTSDTAVVNIAVEAKAVAPPTMPVAYNDSYSAYENQVLTIGPSVGVLVNDLGATLSAELISQPAHGAVTLNADGGFTYTPTTDYDGADSWTYRVWNGTYFSNIATVSMMVVPTDVVLPTLPEDYVIPAYSLPTGGRVYNVAAGTTSATLQSYLNTAQHGDVIILEAGATFTVGDYPEGNRSFEIGPKTGGGWLYIISSDMANLPAEGTRVTPSDAASMPKLAHGDNWQAPALIIWQGTTRVRFAGVEIKHMYSRRDSEQWGIIRVGWNGENDEPQTAPAEDIVFDRCYIHGTPTGNHKDGVVLYNVAGCGIVDCNISEVHEAGYESHGLFIYIATGPTKIHNCLISAAGINIFIGDNRGQSQTWPLGSWPSRYGVDMVPQDITISQCYLYKPLSWNTSDPSYGGIPWTVKNLWETKYSSRVLVEGCVCDGAWQGAQHGETMLITPRGGPVYDTTMRNCIHRNIGRCCNIGSADVSIARVLVENNIFYRRYADPEGAWTVFKMAANSPDTCQDITIRHVTAICEPTYDSWFGTAVVFYGYVSQVGWIKRLNVENNIFPRNGFAGNDKGPGILSLSHYCSAYDVKNNAFVNFNFADCYWQYYPGWTGFTNSFLLSSINDVGFTDTTLDNMTDFVLLPSSAYYAAGSDGLPLGADVATVIAACPDA